MKIKIFCINLSPLSLITGSTNLSSCVIDKLLSIQNDVEIYNGNINIWVNNFLGANVVYVFSANNISICYLAELLLGPSECSGYRNGLLCPRTR